MRQVEVGAVIFVTVCPSVAVSLGHANPTRQREANPVLEVFLAGASAWYAESENLNVIGENRQGGHLHGGVLGQLLGVIGAGATLQK